MKKPINISLGNINGIKQKLKKIKNKNEAYFELNLNINQIADNPTKT